jgi:hypothetical protein
MSHFRSEKSKNVFLEERKKQKEVYTVTAEDSESRILASVGVKESDCKCVPRRGPSSGSNLRDRARRWRSKGTGKGEAEGTPGPPPPEAAASAGT